MSTIPIVSRSTAAIGVLGLGLILSAASFAAPPAKPACTTNGPVLMTAISPAQYSYTQGEAGSESFQFTVSSPAVQVNGNCDSSLPPKFGNGNGTDPSILPLTVSIAKIETGGIAVTASTAAALQAALSSFTTAPFQLTPPGSGSQTISFSFGNSAAIPVGIYDVTVEVKPSETGVGVGTASRSFAIQVEEPQVLDTLAPTVNIVAPVSDASLKVNDSLLVNFTAVDPPEGGAGTGVIATRAAITSCAGSFNYSLSSSLTNSPALPVAADTTVTATTGVTPWLYVGEFTLTAEADDNAGHTGSAIRTFSVGAMVGALPPISVPNRQFNAGSTLPIKFSITDGVGALLPPMDGIAVRITAPSGAIEQRVAGSGASNIRWETDEYGNVTQYITNYVIPATGTYQVDILIGDVCGAPALQGGFKFVAASKGGKQ
ncbi:hypothetical protein GCM10011487_24210 [Steroidobacter agaridevorans]|uniref:Uncharacterized protein n=1 Tax=Steroidobacter agaridevorans TaxID=2695856 RepID=A0A829YC33_9GAMM|nr:hypothetical protein [Steroidobacter agaridevorans]GFE80421.1 hypothetical protein GCM10011487_24210 [Steroidobacter agaridevorans]